MKKESEVRRMFEGAVGCFMENPVDSNKGWVDALRWVLARDD